MLGVDIVATIKDVAKAAGVSFTTVSNVIHGNTKKVSPATIKKINEIMKEMNYVPNMGARMLVRNQSKIIGVILNVFEEDSTGSFQSPFSAEILGAIENEIKKNGYYMMLFSSDSAEEITKLAANWTVDGMITIGMTTEICNEIKHEMRIPVVYTDCYFDAYDQVNVGTMDEEGAYLATKYLLECGHRKIGFANEVEIYDHEIANRVDGLRLRGFQRACAEYGIPYREDMFLAGKKPGQKLEDCGQELVRRLKEFSGIVVSSDYYAIKLMDYLHHRNVRVPEDISIVGFDDIYMAKLTTPRLTTIHQGVAGKGVLAVKQLLKLIRHEEMEEMDTKLPVMLVKRESVREIS